MKQTQAASLCDRTAKVQELASLLTAISTVSRRLAKKMALLEKRLHEKEGESSGQP